MLLEEIKAEAAASLGPWLVSIRAGWPTDN